MVGPLSIPLLELLHLTWVLSSIMEVLTLLVLAMTMAKKARRREESFAITAVKKACEQKS